LKNCPVIGPKFKEKTKNFKRAFANLAHFPITGKVELRWKTVQNFRQFMGPILRGRYPKFWMCNSKCGLLPKM